MAACTLAGAPARSISAQPAHSRPPPPGSSRPAASTCTGARRPRCPGTTPSPWASAWLTAPPQTRRRQSARLRQGMGGRCAGGCARHRGCGSAHRPSSSAPAAGQAPMRACREALRSCPCASLLTRAAVQAQTPTPTPHAPDPMLYARPRCRLSEVELNWVST